MEINIGDIILVRNNLCNLIAKVVLFTYRNDGYYIADDEWNINEYEFNVLTYCDTSIFEKEIIRKM